MANINKNALVTITYGKATGTSRVRFNIPEEMQRTFPISELFKTDVVGFNVKKIEFHEAQGQHTISLQCSIANISLLKATLSFGVHESDFYKVKNFLTEHSENISVEYENKGIILIKSVIECYPPIIQISPAINMGN